MSNRRLDAVVALRRNATVTIDAAPLQSIQVTGWCHESERTDRGGEHTISLRMDSGADCDSAWQAKKSDVTALSIVFSEPVVVFGDKRMIAVFPLRSDGPRSLRIRARKSGDLSAGLRLPADEFQQPLPTEPKAVVVTNEEGELVGTIS